jgi:hypothetical protein
MSFPSIYVAGRKGIHLLHASAAIWTLVATKTPS